MNSTEKPISLSRRSSTFIHQDTDRSGRDMDKNIRHHLGSAAIRVEPSNSNDRAANNFQMTCLHVLQID